MISAPWGTLFWALTDSKAVFREKIALAGFS
jgi:hypothetical protein